MYCCHFWRRKIYSTHNIEEIEFIDEEIYQTLYSHIFENGVWYYYILHSNKILKLFNRHFLFDSFIFADPFYIIAISPFSRHKKW